MLNFQLNIGLGWLVVIVVGLILFMGLAFVAFNYLMYYVMTKRPNLKIKKSNICTISINSSLMKYSAKPASDFQKTLLMIDRVKNLKPKALIIRMNNPGGTPGACHEIYAALQGLKAEGIKVVTLMEDVAASGGVYMSMASDKILATPGTITGSIGVIIHRFDVSNILESLKVKVHHIKSGPHKDMLSHNVPLSEENHKLLEDLIHDCYESFCSIVASSRNLSMEKVKAFATGKIFSAQEAKACGLIDEIGSYKDAVKVAQELAAIPKGEERIQEISLPSSIFEQFALTSRISQALGFVEDMASLSELSGKPLWLMPK